MATFDPTSNPGSNVTFYRNGVQTATGNISQAQNVSPALVIGDQWQGQISEVLVYDHVLSSNEIQQVGQYLTQNTELPPVGSVALITKVSSA